MAKEKRFFFCSECGHKSSKWLGRCPECEEWGSFSEEVKLKAGSSSSFQNLKDINVKKFEDIEIKDTYRYKTNLKEFDRVLGGGLVRGEIVLLTGSPGVGKSTLLLQCLKEYSESGKVLYISGEESVSQIKDRGNRLGIKGKNLYIMAETEIGKIYDYVITQKPKVVVADSIQTLYSSASDSIPGTISQIRECTLKIMELAKQNDISFFIVGHITKDGKIAGPKLLEHMVDAVLHFEGEEDFFYRILRSIKNRFGSTNEIGIFNMDENGMTEVKNPSEFFLSERESKNVGSIVVPVLEGTKIFLLEVQALTTTTNFGIPRRVIQGLDKNRMQIIAAILEKKLSLNLNSQDIYFNVPGGIAIRDTSADLGAAMALISSVKNIEISQKIASIGELGLRGEIRKVSFMEKRLKEIEKLGFTGVYLPYANKKDVEKKDYKLKIIYLKNINELLERMN